MTLPAIFFGIVLSTTYGTAFHVLKGGRLGKLFLFIILAWLGFWLGLYIGDSLKWRFFTVGTLNIGMATIGSLIFLIIGDWLSRVEVTQK
jgi:hypothetical protein